MKAAGNRLTRATAVLHSGCVSLLLSIEASADPSELLGRLDQAQEDIERIRTAALLLRHEVIRGASEESITTAVSMEAK
jgi:hypothetical protein